MVVLNRGRDSEILANSPQQQPGHYQLAKNQLNAIGAYSTSGRRKGPSMPLLATNSKPLSQHDWWNPYGNAESGP